MIPNRRLTALAVAVAAAGGASRLEAQATTGTIGGRVTGPGGQPVEGVQVQVLNPATGRSAGATTRADGRFTVAGLEPGNQYRVTARRVGFAPRTTSVSVALGTITPVQFQLEQQAAQLSEVTVTSTAASSNALIAATSKGTATTITDTLIRKLPTLNRNFTDFTRLTPQVSESGPGLSGGGVNNRYNNIQIDGATAKDLFGLGSTGQPGGQANGKSIGIESVKEYQVLLAPFDVRIGNFAGVSVNAITKSGTNTFSGSAYTFTRNQSFQRDQPYLTDFNQTQYGLSLGGPVVRNKVFFFVNPEFQQRRQPATGFALGDAGSNVTQGQLDQFTTALTNAGLTDLGTAGRINNKNPLSNVFARLDVALPFNSTLVLRHNYAAADQDVFSRGTAGATPNFGLSSNAYRFTSVSNQPTAQLRTNFGNGGYNEVIAGYTRIRDKRATPGTRQASVFAIQPNVAQFIAGTDNSSQSNELDQDILELTDNLTIPVGGAHRVTVGTQNQFYKVRNLFGQNVLGNWTFGTLDSLTQGIARTYQVSVPVSLPDGTPTDGAVRFRAANYSGYIQDEWTATDRLSITAGVRVDVPTFRDRPPLNQTVQTTLGINTTEFPSGNPQVSPRLGFNWNATGDSRNQVRGGAGLFTGQPAYVWLSNSFQNSGGASGFASLTCNIANVSTPPPAFTAANVANAPRQCGTVTATAGSDVNFIRDDVRFPQTARLNLAYDRDLGGGVVATVEGLYTRTLNNLFYANYALAGYQVNGAQAVGVDGRVLYGPTANNPLLRVTGRNTALGVINQSKDYSYNLTGKLEKRFRNNFGGAVAYTYTQAYDVQSLTSSTAASQYQFGRVYAGDQLEQNVSHSAFETPHRVIANGSYTLKRLGTSLSAIYTGQSGVPFAYVSSTDLNGDGRTGNDPIYIPTGLNDPKAPVFAAFQTFTTGQQAAAFDAFIQNTPCLREQRGRIMGRNTCRSNWTNSLDLSVEQPVRTFRGQSFSIRLDAINFANFVDRDLGRRVSGFNPNQTVYTSTGTVLSSNGSTTGANLVNGVPRVNFTPAFQRFNYDNAGSNYTFQLGARYAF